MCLVPGRVPLESLSLRAGGRTSVGGQGARPTCPETGAKESEALVLSMCGMVVWHGGVVWCGLQEPTWVPGSASSSSDRLSASGFQSRPGPRDEKPSASLVDLLVRSCAVIFHMQLEPDIPLNLVGQTFHLKPFSFHCLWSCGPPWDHQTGFS